MEAKKLGFALNCIRNAPIWKPLTTGSATPEEVVTVSEAAAAECWTSLVVVIRGAGVHDDSELVTTE